MTLNDYIALISGHNRDKENFIALVSAVLQQVMDLQAVITGVMAAFTPDGASGAQLDMVGELFGLRRVDTTDGVEATDTVFRDYIKKKLILWAWDGTNATVPVIAQKLAEDSTDTDNQNGTVTITGAGTQPAPVKALYPVAAGIRVTQ